ncbi:uncharacterized protein LOC134225799 [Armigeres subalbatus]|uniref:uncharacterized protein LOC134225799 n=1 Tax=Armigeres subalbatus TaxID=124917 RepID=UPI002ED27F5F
MSFSAKLDQLQKGFAESGRAGESLQQLRDLLESIPKQVDREKTAVYVFKDLLTLFGDVAERGAQDPQCQILEEGLRYLVEVCRGADDAIRCHFVLRVYNLVVKFSASEDKRTTVVQCARLMESCYSSEEHMELFLRVSRVVLKMIYDVHTRKLANQRELISAGIDVICSTTLRLLKHWAESSQLETRSKALAIYSGIFDNSVALLYRLFSMDQKRTDDFFDSVVQILRTSEKFSESEMAELFQRTLPYLETILSFGEASKPYLKYLEVLSVFENIKNERTATCVWVLRKYLIFQNSSNPNMEMLMQLSERLKYLSGNSSPDALLMEVIIFITIQLGIHLNQIKQQSLEFAEPLIELCKSLSKFGKYCPRNYTQLCARCGSSSRHFVDFVSTMVINLVMAMSKAGKKIKPELVGLVNGFLRHKMLTLDDLSCEKKTSLLDAGLRYVVNWIRSSLQYVSGTEVLDLARLAVEFKYKYDFDFLTDTYLIRLVENCLKDFGICQAAIDIKFVRLIMALRADVVDSKEVEETIYAIVNFQLSIQNESIRDLNLVDMIERNDFNRFGFCIDPTLTRQEKASILIVEMNLASRYKSANVMQYFQNLQELDADPLRLGMALYLFQDVKFYQITQEETDALKRKILKTKPTNSADTIRRNGALGVLNYYAFSATSKAVVSKLKDAQLNRETIKKDQINNVLKENTMEQELVLLAQLEETYSNYRDMVLTLAETSFEHFNIIYSLNQISSMIDNTSRFFVINYYPRRAVETQLLNYLLISQKPERIAELCCPLGFLIENHQIYLQVLNDPLYNKPWAPTLDSLFQKATEIIVSHSASLLESRKYHFLNLYLALSQYEASRQNIPAAIAHIQTLAALLENSPPNCTTTAIVRGRIYHTIFRLVTLYNVPTPRNMPVRNFIRLMLAHYNEMQKLPADQGFIVSTSTLEMTVETLRYLTLHYDTDRLEAHVEQLLRFVLRRGAGLRAMQLMIIYAAMSADSEKLDKCQMLLTYLDRLLMFRPLESDNKDTAMALEVPVISLADDSTSRNHIRKAVKYVKSPTMNRSPSPQLFPDQPIDHQQYLIHHHSNCSCQFCRFPQYKGQALLVATLYARLAFLKDQSGRCQEIYEAVTQHWKLQQNAFATPNLIGHKDEFVTLMGRAFLFYGQFLIKEEQVEQARVEFEKSREILRSVPIVDLGLEEEVEINITSLSDPQLLNQKSKVVCRLPDFESYLKENPRVAYPATPLVKAGKMNTFTPRVGTARVFPKTAVRADDLIKLVARKRLKTTLAKDYTKESDLISAMSGLSCTSEKRPTAVSIFVDTPEKPSNAVVLKGKKKLFTQATSSKDSEESPKKRGRRKKTEDETPAAPKTTRKKRIPLSPTLKTTASNESFKDILVKCSTPISISHRTEFRTATSKKLRMKPAFPKLTQKQSKSPEIALNHSFNSSFRDVLMQSLSEATGTEKERQNGSVIVLDDSEEINTSLTQNHSVNKSQNGYLSLKKYSDRKVATANGLTRSTRKVAAKMCLQFDTSSTVIDITTPDNSPAILRTVGSSGENGPTMKSTAKKTATKVEEVKRTRGRPRKNKEATVSSNDALTKEISPETIGEVIVPRTTRNKVRGRRGE